MHDIDKNEIDILNDKVYTYIDENKLVIVIDNGLKFPRLDIAEENEALARDIDYNGPASIIYYDRHPKPNNISFMGCDFTTGCNLETMLLDYRNVPYAETIQFIDCNGVEEVKEAIESNWSNSEDTKIEII